VFSTQRFVEPSQVGVLILSNSIYCGIYLVKIELPEKCTLVGLIRAGQFIPASVNTTIHSGDYILGLAIHPMMVPALKVTLKKTHSISYYPQNCTLTNKKIFDKIYPYIETAVG
jgi:hypothetical protein